MSAPLTRIRRGLLFLAVFFVFAVCFRNFLSEDGTLLESIYWLVITVSSVGYGERSTISPELQMFSILVIVIGMLAAAYTFGGLIQLMTEGEMERALGVRRMTRDIGQLEGHVIICGYGRTGRILAEDLARQDVPFVVIDVVQDAIVEAQADGYLAMVGDATEEHVLEEASVTKATTLISALNEDADNVFLTLTARNLSPDLRIIARGEQPATERKLLQAGANRVVLPAVIGARRIGTLVTRPHTAELIERLTDVSTLDVDLKELVIPSTSPLVNQTVRNAEARRKHKLLVVAVRRADGEMVFNPDADLTFLAGDTLIVMGLQDDVTRFRNEFGI